MIYTTKEIVDKTRSFKISNNKLDYCANYPFTLLYDFSIIDDSKLNVSRLYGDYIPSYNIRNTNDVLYYDMETDNISKYYYHGLNNGGVSSTWLNPLYIFME